MKPWLFFILSAVFLQGCSLFGVGEAEYACSEPGKGVCKSARQIYDDIQTPPDQYSNPPPPLIPEPSNSNLITPEPVAHRTPAQILKIWIAPWVDKQGNWHSGGVVMTDISPREWQSAIPVYSPTDP